MSKLQDEAEWMRRLRRLVRGFTDELMFSWPVEGKMSGIRHSPEVMVSGW